jgi:hypothetical protein
VGSLCACNLWNPYLIAKGAEKFMKQRRCATKCCGHQHLSDCYNYKSFATRNFIKMVKKRVRDAEVLPEAPVQASTQGDGSGSDEVDFLVTLQSPLLIPL